MNTKIQIRFTLGKLLAVAAGCLAFQSAQASLLFSEGFNYPAGAGVGGNVNPGSGVAWTGNSNVTVDGTDPVLTYSGLNNISVNNMKVVWGVSSGTVKNDPAFSTVSSGQVYYSFLLDMTALPSSTGSGTYLTALNAAGANPNGSSDAVDIYINNSGVMTMKSKGVSASANTTLSLDTTYLVVLEYDFGANLSSIYVNPDSSTFGAASAPAAFATATPAVGAITGLGDLGFKAQTSSTSGTFLVDNILVGTTWADVTPAAVPEPSTIALAGLGLLGLAARCRRARQ